MNKKLEPAERLERWKENQPFVRMAQEAFRDSTDSESALELLHDPDLFPLLLADIGKAGLVREKRNALATYIIATSRLRNKPLNEIIKGKSSGGKNYLAKTVLKFFPDGEVVSGSSMTARAVDYAGTNRFKHKVIYIDEQVGRNHPLRQLISEGRQIRWSSQLEGGQRVMKEHVTQGPVACITTTTQNALAIDDENKRVRLAAKVKAATINRDLALLRQLMKRAERERYIGRNPFVMGNLFLEERKGRRQPHIMTYEEESRLTGVAPPMLKALVILLVETGLRVGKEALPLKWTDIEFGNGTIQVRESKTLAGRRIVPL